MMIAARTRGSDTAAGALRTAVLQVDPDQPLYRLQSLESLLYEERSGARATAQVLGFLAAIAMVLAAVGAYGVMSYAAAQRTREIGIRLALGASASKVFRMVLGGGLAVAAIGLGVGLPAAYGVAPLLRTIDSGVQAGDVATYAGVTALLFGAALVACAVPAWRAMRADPATVLREE
jgi:ABC-type antimicrobial peptide transport system permease subunit